MNISLKEWARYRDKLTSISQKAGEEFVSFYNSGVANNSITRKDILDYANALVNKYGEATSALAAEMYDEIADMSNVVIPAAEPAAVATYGETAKAINGALKMSPAGNLLEGVMQRLVKQPAADTTLKNALRDGAQFAWVPNGDTCVFCLTLASRGWQYASKEAIKGGHAEHIHAHCDCQYAIRFDENTNVEGYDPKKYLDMYNSQEGTPQEKINAMRREQYAENKEAINARKRELYRLNKEA